MQAVGKQKITNVNLNNKEVNTNIKIINTSNLFGKHNYKDN